jgi:hypothetical protein
MNNEFYFLTFILLILIFATIIFQGFTKSGIIILLMLLISSWKVYKELYNISNVKLSTMET